VGERTRVEAGCSSLSPCPAREASPLSSSSEACFWWPRSGRSRSGAGFYEFEEANGSAPTSPSLYEDIDALVAAAHIEKEWMPDLSASMFRLSDTGWAWSENLRRRVKKDALSRLEDAVAWVKEQSYLELIHKTSTIRVIG